MKDLETFLRESKQVKQKPLVVKNLPDAIVLIIIDMSCRTCGNKVTYPNTSLLMRRGRQRLRIKQWLFIYSSLPREVVRFPEYCDACENCFDGNIPLADNFLERLEN